MPTNTRTPPPSTTTPPATTTTGPPSNQDCNLEEANHPDDDPRLPPLEAAVLTEYAKLRSNLDALNTHLSHLSATPSSVVADGLRLLERKTSLVCTALKSSVYGIVLQQQIEFAGDEEG